MSDAASAPEWIRVAQDGNGLNGGFWTSAAATETSPKYIREDIVTARIEALAAEVERLRVERMQHLDYSADLQRIIECICHKRTIRTPFTTARYHFDLAVKYRAEEESAERVLAEAVEIMKPFAEGSIDVAEAAIIIGYPATKPALAAARDFITAQEKEKGS